MSSSRRNGFHVISYRKIREFLETHPGHAEVTEPLDRWYRTVKRANWANFAEVREIYPHADAVGHSVIFNIAGNKLRVVAEILYPQRVLLLRAVLTHSEYDKIDFTT